MNVKGLKSMTQMIGGSITKNSPTILTGLSVAGLVSTTIMAVRATPKALQIIEDKMYNEDTRGYTNEVTTKDAIAATWKCYIPAAIMGAVTIGCIISANSINLRRNTALASVYTLTETALKEYKAKVVETIGENKEKELRGEIAKDRVSKNPVVNNEIIISGKGETLCYDALSGRYFRSDMEAIKSAVNVCSRRLMTDMFTPLNDIYSELNIEGTKLGDLMGWFVGDGLIEPSFSTCLADDGRPCLVLDFETQPKYCDRDY